MSNTSPAGRSLLSLVVAGVAWGTAGAAASLLFLASDLGPVSLTFWRCAGGLLVLLAVLAVRRPRPASARDLPASQKSPLSPLSPQSRPSSPSRRSLVRA